jgi:hypothetical protein
MSSADSHPVVLAEPPQPPEFDANADLPSLASVALSSGGEPNREQAVADTSTRALALA